MGEQRPTRRREPVVLARWTGRRFVPLVIQQAVAPHLAEQRIERALARGEVGRRQPVDDVARVHIVRGDDGQNEELEQAFADLLELLQVEALKLPCASKVALPARPVKCSRTLHATGHVSGRAACRATGLPPLSWIVEE